MENIDLIDRYIRLEMTESERQDFEARLLEDSELNALYKETLNIKENLRHKKLKEKKAFFQDLEAGQESSASNTESETMPTNTEGSAESKKEAKVVKFPFMKYAVAASLTLLLGFFGYKAINNSSSFSGENAYADIFTPEKFVNYRYHETTRSMSDDKVPQDDVENNILRNMSKEQKLAFILYDSQNFEKAIPYLEKLWKNNQDELALYYLGMSYLGKGDIETAKKYLSMPEVSKYKNPFE